MSETLHVKVVTPKGSLIDQEASSFTAKTALGEFCILPNHRPIMAAIVVGPMVIQSTAGSRLAYALDRGYMEAGSDHVNVITERCVSGKDLEKAALEQEVSKLEDEITAMDAESDEARPVIAALEWAKTRLQVTEISVD